MLVTDFRVPVSIRKTFSLQFCAAMADVTDMFRMPELIPLGSRIATRLALPSRTPEQLKDYLDFALEQAGNSSLMTAELMQLLASHSLNNLRVINNMAAELLAAASERNLPRIDEALYFELFNPASAKPRRGRVS